MSTMIESSESCWSGIRYYNIKKKKDISYKIMWLIEAIETDRW